MISAQVSAQDKIEIREFEPFKVKNHVVHGATRGFHISEAWVKNLTTKLLVKIWHDAESPMYDSKVLESVEGVQFKVAYTDPNDYSENPQSEVVFNLPLDEISAELLQVLRKPVGGFKDPLGKKYRARMKRIRESFRVNVRDFTAPVQEIDLAKSKICPADEGGGPGTCKDQIVYKTVVKKFKDITLSQSE